MKFVVLFSLAALCSANSHEGYHHYKQYDGQKAYKFVDPSAEFKLVEPFEARKLPHFQSQRYITVEPKQVAKLYDTRRQTHPTLWAKQVQVSNPWDSAYIGGGHRIIETIGHPFADIKLVDEPKVEIIETKYPWTSSAAAITDTRPQIKIIESTNNNPYVKYVDEPRIEIIGSQYPTTHWGLNYPTHHWEPKYVSDSGIKVVDTIQAKTYSPFENTKSYTPYESIKTYTPFEQTKVFDYTQGKQHFGGDETPKFYYAQQAQAPATYLSTHHNTHHNTAVKGGETYLIKEHDNKHQYGIKKETILVNNQAPRYFAVDHNSDHKDQTILIKANNDHDNNNKQHLIGGKKETMVEPKVTFIYHNQNQKPQQQLPFAEVPKESDYLVARKPVTILPIGARTHY